MGGRGAAVRFLGSFPGDVPETGLPEVAFAGRSNVGKSSALNALLGQKKAARVSSTPGRTQAINLFDVGGRVGFVDLPGYGFAKVPDAVAAGWKPMIERYLGERERLRLVVVLIDARLPAQDMDAYLVDGLRDAGLPVLVVATKLDKLAKHERKPALARLRAELDLPDDQPIGFSGRTGDGVDAVWARIDAACEGAP
jgi:GTP-binding protein